MANIVNNDKGFKVICLSKEEAASLGFGYKEDGSCVCMHCGNDCGDSIYYIAVLNDTMCERCFHRWVAGATFYPEDMRYEEKSFERTVNNLTAIWGKDIINL